MQYNLLVILMKSLTPLIKKCQKYSKKVLILLFISFIIGFFLAHKLNNLDLLNELKNISYLLETNHFNLIFHHIFLICFLSILIFLFLAKIIIPLYFIIEFSSIFFNIFTFIKVFHFKGLIFSLIYNFSLKFLYLIFIFIFLKKLLNIFYIITKSIKNNKIIDKNLLKDNLKYLFLCFILILLNDILIYFYGTKILLEFIFILK